MRFHFGVSFRLSSLKKFIFPILFGVLAYFLSSYINLGQVYALENSNTTYNFTFEEINFSDYMTFTDKTTQQVIDEVINSYNYSTHDLLITFYSQNNTYTLFVYLMPHLPNIQMGVEGYNKFMYFYDEYSYTSLNGVYFYRFQANQSFTSSNSSIYQDLLACVSDISFCDNNSNTIDGTQKGKVNVLHRTEIFNYGSSFSNEQSYVFNSLVYYGWIYYSSNSLVYNSKIDSNSNTRFTKNLIINNISISDQDNLPTYLDLFPVIPDEPEPEPEPDVSNVPFSSKVYWFGEHDTSEEILENIYILLFLSFSGIFFLKVITIIKNTRW